MQTVFLCLVGLALALFAVVLYCALVVASDADDAMEIRAERVMTPEVTPPPEPAEEVKAVVTYPVPLSQEIQDYVVQTCLEYEVSPCVVFALIGVESGYDASKIGDNGRSYGLMQIYASQHTGRCARLNTVNLLDPKQNVLTGIDYLAELLATGHDIEWCLSWYNGHGGEPCEYARTVLCNAEQILEGVQVSPE
jgi:hypothetical protein